MNKHRRQTRTLFFVTLAFLVTLTLGACETDQPETEVPTTDTPATGQQMPPAQQDTGQGVGGVAAEEIEGDPSEYMGQTVRVEGQIADVYGQNSFTMEGNWLGGNLLVVVPQDAGAGDMTFSQGDDVQITGDVREYVATDLETEYGIDLGETIDYEEQEPVIIAQEVTPGAMQQPAE